jgi:hypothetical protein
MLYNQKMESMYWNSIEARLAYLESLLETNDTPDTGKTKELNREIHKLDTFALRLSQIESDVEPLKTHLKRIFDDWDTIRVLWDRPGTESGLRTLSEAGQIDYLLTWVPDLKRAMQQLSEIHELQPLLDSQVWSSALKDSPTIAKIAQRQLIQQAVVQDLTDRVDVLLVNYTAYVNAVSDLFSWYHATLRHLETQ